MKIWLRDWFALIALAMFLGAGLMYSFVYDPNAGAKNLRESTVKACQRGLAKAKVFEAFANKAADARRNSAASEQERGETVQAQNDISAAEAYESFAIQYAELTPSNCEAQYPVP